MGKDSPGLLNKMDHPSQNYWLFHMLNGEGNSNNVKVYNF